MLLQTKTADNNLSADIVFKVQTKYFKLRQNICKHHENMVLRELIVFFFGIFAGAYLAYQEG